MNVRTVALFLALLSSSTAFGYVVITPPSPHSVDKITILVENAVGTGGNVTSASIIQVGNTFVIQQNISVVACSPIPPPPNIPVIGSQFQVGPLAPGAYNVTATTNIAPCSGSIPQKAAFAVTAPGDTPALDALGLLVLAAALAVSALAVLGMRR